MLTESCHKTIGLLMTDEDFNVPTTIAKKAKKAQDSPQNSLIESFWRGYIWNSIGAYSTMAIEFHVEILVASNEKVQTYNAILAGDEITTHFWQYIKSADGIRINLLQNKKKLSWIIVRP